MAKEKKKKRWTRKKKTEKTNKQTNKNNTSEAEIVYLIEFKALVIHILTELGEKIDELNENFKKNPENIYKKSVRSEE